MEKMQSKRDWRRRDKDRRGFLIDFHRFLLAGFGFGFEGREWRRGCEVERAVERDWISLKNWSVVLDDMFRVGSGFGRIVVNVLRGLGKKGRIYLFWKLGFEF